jgi:DMSO/TMAO reductase YedYZ molybdopterin-dependent catalytic subunit
VERGGVAAVEEEKDHRREMVTRERESKEGER